MRFHAFQGYRYAKAAGDPGLLAAPPFDQIDRVLRTRLHQQDPHQFAHLTRPLGESRRAAAHNAAHLHRSWHEQGLIVRDPHPSLYPYAIELAGGGRRLGICGLAGIEEPGSDRIRPHEHTVAKTVAQRLDLLRATRVDLEPIFLLSDDPGTLEALLRDDLARATALVEHRDSEGHRHLLYRLDAAERIEEYRRALSVPAVIADGHHRYRVAQLFAEETGPEAGAASRCKLVVVTSLRSPGVKIEPIHRLLRVPFPDNLEGGRVVERLPWEGTSGQAMAAAVAAAAQPSLGVWRRAGRPEIWRLDPSAGPARLAPAASKLSVVLFHDPLLRDSGFDASTATDGTVLYRSDPDDPWDSVAAGDAEAAFWLPPMPPDAFAAAVARGDLLPPKSTRFVPKLVSGLVWCGHDAQLG